MHDVMDDVAMMVMMTMMARSGERAERDAGQHRGDEQLEAETRGTHGISLVS